MNIMEKIKITNNSTKILIERMRSILDEIPKNCIVGYCTDGPIFGYDPEITQIIDKYEKDLKKIEESVGDK